MSGRGHGQIRRSQVITTWGPGALMDLPRYAVIVGGLESWGKLKDLEEITEPRLAQKIAYLTGVDYPKLYAPPPDTAAPWEKSGGIGVWRFPKWFLVQEERGTGVRERSRRLVHRKALDKKSRFEGLRVVPTRFVRACVRGHLDDIDWFRFVHGKDTSCNRMRQLWLDERGTGGDLADLEVRCECDAPARKLSEAMVLDAHPLGYCSGERPWLGLHAREECDLPARLLIRTASNAYFPQVWSVLALPDRGTELERVVRELWKELQLVEDERELGYEMRKPHIGEALAPFNKGDILETIRGLRKGATEERPVKQVELDAILAAPEGYGDDVPIDNDFHARRLPDHVWRRSDRTAGIEAVIQLHRLREVLALTGFTRFEPLMPDIHGEYDTDVERAALAQEPSWFPAVENRGEGFFLQLCAKAVERWLKRKAVQKRLDQLHAGHLRWQEDRTTERPFPGGPYVLIHSLSHLLIQSVAMRCGYPASSIRERIYVDPEEGQFGLLLYTGSPDAEGTLGGLVQQARHVQAHLTQALQSGSLCSNDPICAQHEPGETLEGRWLHGAACHGCALVAETSCEMRNDYLDRALVVPTIVTPDAAFFQRNR